MEHSIYDYLAQEPIGVLTVLLPDGSPHSATVHYSSQLDPLTLYISTDQKTRKAEVFKTQDSTKASFVVGVSEATWLTLQMHGEANVVRDPEELKAAQAIHYAKHPKALPYKNDDTIVIKFTPTWWRYSDYTARPPKIIQSEA